ncbi:hypothetical protein IPA_03255 [Ignicoccus pacificus DSM 13166]|uniref:Uncharacterized protein n=1 Tax=Ignicoccus pacificus DSM 13166 TaxID=940294 RepID=A0A977PJZ9_9CREN|nr:hypothetical protein IPA_03255 [Ignicoccus pacificus DSM 13166]
MLGLDKMIEMERKKEELKRALFVRFNDEQIKEMMRELRVRDEKELYEILTFEDLVEFARKFKVSWWDLYQEYERLTSHA